jgi:hypothetical protein
MISIMQIVTLEGWNKMMYNYYNSWNPAIVSIYFTTCVIVGSFFLLNLLLAVLWMNFNITKLEGKEEDDVELVISVPESLANGSICDHDVDLQHMDSIKRSIPCSRKVNPLESLEEGKPASNEMHLSNIRAATNSLAEFEGIKDDKKLV